MQCLVAAIRPLRVEELAEVLAFDFSEEGIPKLNRGWRWEDQEEAVMSACSSLVVVVKDGDSRIVQFAHFSVKEFLTSDRLAGSSREEISQYHIPLEAAHTILAQACLGVLLKLDDSIVSDDNIKNFPLAEYAAQYWVEHAKFEGVLSRIKDGMECLFDADKPHFAAWLGIYDVEHPRYSGPAGTPIYYASRLGFYSLVEHLITRHPEDVNAVGGNYETPLHVSAGHGHVEIVLLLLKHLPVDIRSTFHGRRPLHSAAVRGHVEVGRVLLNRGADVNAQQNDGWTPLHLAAWFGHIEFMRLLLDRGADPHARNDDGNTPSEEEGLRYRPQQDVLQLLSEYNVKSEEQ